MKMVGGGGGEGTLYVTLWLACTRARARDARVGPSARAGAILSFRTSVRWHAGRGVNFAPINALRAQTHPPSLPNRTQSWPTVAPRAAVARPAHISQPLGNRTPRHVHHSPTSTSRRFSVTSLPTLLWTLSPTRFIVHPAT